MNLTEILMKRYSTKSFNPEKTIPSEVWSQMEDALRLSASSTNAQPWHFVISSTKEGKQRLIKGTEPKFPFNTQKILSSSHAVLFCAKTDLNEDYLRHVLDVEDKDGRYAKEEMKEQMHGGRNFFANIHKEELNDLQHWNEKQVYLNIGNALLGAATLGLDALPMEGVDIEALNTEFKLKEKGLSAVALVTFGYQSDDDFNAKLPKSRLPKNEIFTQI